MAYNLPLTEMIGVDGRSKLGWNIPHNGSHYVQILNWQIKSRDPSWTGQQCMNVTIKYAKVSAFMTPKTNARVNCVTNDLTVNTSLRKKTSKTFSWILQGTFDNTKLEQNFCAFL